MSRHKVRLGVTGLRRTGKTVFLTSLIYQLRERGSRDLAAFDARAIELLPSSLSATTGLDKFPLETYIADLRQKPPRWPDPTEFEYQTTLMIPFRENNARGCYRFLPRKLRNRLKTRTGTIELQIHDYPGEFLLDVDLARLSFDEWSRAARQRMREQCPKEAERYERVFRDGTQDGEYSESLLSHLRAVYADYVAAAHLNYFEMIQPGMALLPWTRNLPANRGPSDPGCNILPFVPLPEEAAMRKGLENLRRSLREAYGRYVENDVSRFIQALSASSSQIVLVDVLRVLSNGLPCYNDTRQCLESILTAYRYSGKWFGKRIRRVVFVAAKADHALNGHRPNMARLLETLVEKARGRIGGGLSPRYRWLASLRATSDAVDRKSGRPQELLRGTLVDEQEESVWNPGPVPSEWPDRVIPPTTEPWVVGNDFYQFPRFAPPHFPARDGAPVAHLNLDELLWDILEPCFSYQTGEITDAKP